MVVNVTSAQSKINVLTNLSNVVFHFNCVICSFKEDETEQCLTDLWRPQFSGCHGQLQSIH